MGQSHLEEGASPVRVLFEPIGRKVDARAGDTLLDAAITAGIGIRSECGGIQTCGKCRVVVGDLGHVSEVTDKERRHLSQSDILKGVRLACAARLLPDSEMVIVSLPPESTLRERRFVELGVERRVKLNPRVRKILLSLEDTTSLNQSGPEMTLARLLRKRRLTRAEFDKAVGCVLPSTLDHGGVATVVLDGSRVLEVEEGDTRRRSLGLAVDVGTSRITARVVDLVTGENLGSASIENPQIPYGEDVMSRAGYAQQSDENRLRLQRAVIDGVNILIRRLLGTGINGAGIYQSVIVGNTVMHHLLLGLDTSQLTRSPFKPREKKMIEVRASEIGLDINPAGIVVLLPIIDAFVGSDAVADIVSSGLQRSIGPTLLLDIGTNTELVLRAEGETLCCSCASGPAFEGAHIEHGMKAVEGAIEGISIGEGGQEVGLRVLGGEKPVGLCGSAMIDVVAEMLRRGIIDRVGRFNRGIDSPRMNKVGNARKFVLAWEEESGTGKPITISERDINELILAKAAIYSGGIVLMKTKGVPPADLRRLLVAGAFGNHLNKRNAKAIGLIPEIGDRRITYMGNAAIVGAAMALKSLKTQRLAERISEKVRYVELATSPDFESEYKKALWLPHRDVIRNK